MEIKKYSREKLIISTDDFGKSRMANENILALVLAGQIDRVSVLMDGEIKNSEVEKLLSSGVKIDIHLNLQKINDHSNESRNVFKRIAIFLAYYLLKTNSVVGKEWEQQVKKFISLFGRKPDGLNSHQYIHFFPPYFKLVLELGKKYDIPYLRFGKNGISENVNSISRILKGLWIINAAQFKKFSFASSEYLASYDWAKDFSEFLKKLPAGKTELIFHPERKEEFEAINKYF